MSQTLSDRLHLLFRLQDLDTMIAEATDPARQKANVEMGFRTPDLAKLKIAREKLAEQCDPADLRTYDRIAQRHPHAIVPVADRTCLGCYMSLPTSAVSLRTEPGQFRTCENCGRILYWLT